MRAYSKPENYPACFLSLLRRRRAWKFCLILSDPLMVLEPGNRIQPHVCAWTLFCPWQTKNTEDRKHPTHAKSNRRCSPSRQPGHHPCLLFCYCPLAALLGQIQACLKQKQLFEGSKLKTLRLTEKVVFEQVWHETQITDSSLDLLLLYGQVSFTGLRREIFKEVPVPVYVRYAGLS